MKILTGSLRGRTVLFKPNPHLRPTADKVKKAIFDMLHGALEGKQVLDLFSGTGALGFEALSAGAVHTTFVELDKKQAERISENIKRLGLSGRACVTHADALVALADLSRRGMRFDFIFIDPPYGRGLGRQVLQRLSEGAILKEEGFIVFECKKQEDFLNQAGPFSALQTKTYGDTRIVIYGQPRRPENAPQIA